VQLRAARPGEAQTLTELALRSKAYWGYDDAFMAACRDELTMRADELERRRVTVAERDGRIAGFVSVEGEPPEGAVGMMFVDPELIGRGVGRLLFEHALGSARSAGFTRLTIDADPNAAPFYRSMGAVQIGETPSGSIPGRTLPLLEIALGT